MLVCMCGIGGILRVWPAERREEALAMPHGRSIPEAWLDTIDDAIKHRGPDGRGRFRDRALRADGCVVDVALVHRRLSIIDHTGGHQPMLSLGLGTGVVGRSRLALGGVGGGLGLYGRDAASELVGDGPGLDGPAGASRLSEMRDLDATGSPHFSLRREARSARVCVVFNGCIYNHRELRAELERAGHVFTTDHSDTEVLVHGWREWGAGVWGRLDGMFAACVWDANAGHAQIARDRCGEKPLYYLSLRNARKLPGQTLVFSSEAGSPARLGDALVGDAGSDLASDSLRNWTHYGFGARPPSRALGTVSPGETIREESGAAGGFVPREFWHPPARQTDGGLTVDTLDAALSDAVGSRLGSDAPLGCFLSGGVDSSLVAALALGRLGRLRTFCVRMPDPRYDESAHAQHVADHLGTEHLTLDCAGLGRSSAADDLERLIRQVGLPLGDSSLLPTYWVSRAAREHVAVALSGDGGDELFCGYERYRAAILLRRWRRLLASIPLPSSWADAPRGRRSRVARLVNAARGGGYLDLLRVFGPDDAERLDLREHGRRESVPPTWSGSPNGHAAPRNLPEVDAPAWDFSVYLPQDLLSKVDTASMSVALEVRAPLLAPSLVDGALSTPLSVLMPRGQRKGLLRQVARRYLPAAVVDRPKQGFAIPIGDWFRSDYGGLRSMLLDHLGSTEPFGPPGLGIGLNMRYVRQMLDEHLGTGPSGRVVRDHSQRLYMLLVLSVWARWMGGLAKKRRDGEATE